MKHSALGNVLNGLIAQSLPFIILNAMGCKKEKIEYVDKKTGQKASFSFFNHKCTTTGEEADFAIIRDSIPKGEDAEKATRPSYKGKRILVIINGFVKDQKTGINTYDARSIEPIDNDDVDYEPLETLPVPPV